MADQLKDVLRKARKRKGWSLRKAAAVTGIHNAHLSQLETGSINQPGEALLWALADAYEIDYMRLLRLAGHTTKDPSQAGKRSMTAAAFHAIGDLDENEQRQVLEYMDKLRRDRREDEGSGP